MASVLSDVIKREGQRPTESFSQSKLEASLVAACLSVRSPIGQAESIAKNVCKKVIEWLESKPEVTSRDLRLVAGRHLEAHHPDAAYLYQQHRVTL
ncbi:MAG: hypothetical protein JWN33_105 [Candidatus Saccharibacteria bacterium]|jgi:transcriptional regulator NrdR family protein|nr:hypothetical protein [Candidatus Saccharibacteria bacterium]